MPIVNQEDAELKAIMAAAEMMAVSARTAPKGKGMDEIKTVIVFGEEKEKIAEEMERIGKEKKLDYFIRDANSVKKSKIVLLIGVKTSKGKGTNCGGCGFKTCEEFNKSEKILGNGFKGPSCVMYVLDLGIAIGSAVKTASMLNIDNRIMYSIGATAMKMKLMDADMIIGIPLSATGKNIFFDRKI